MSANNLGRINNSRFEANYQSIIPTGLREKEGRPSPPNSPYN